MARFHTLTYPVCVGDTDCFGVLYQASVMRRFDDARQLALGPHRLLELWEQQGLGIFLVDIHMRFKGKAVLGDVLEVRSSFALEGEFRLLVHQEALKNGQAVVTAEVQKACVDRQGNLKPMPAPIRQFVHEYAS
jgi:acyl-CoA thioester hydrolase